MKLRELTEICNRLASEKPCRNDYEVRIVTAGEYVDGYWYGRTPSVGITSAEDGFDWDNEVILLMPDKALIRKGKK